MKRILKSLPAFLLAGSLGLLIPSVATSGTSNSHSSNTKAPAKHAMFNPASIETVQGQVADVKTTRAKKGMAEFERLDLKTAHGTMPVVLGPASYVDKEKVKINKGDDISVTGSRVTLHKKQELVATQIKKGDKTLDLRKSDGTPLWSSNDRQGSRK